jgi:hypothetical protein
MLESVVLRMRLSLRYLIQFHKIEDQFRLVHQRQNHALKKKSPQHAARGIFYSDCSS